MSGQRTGSAQREMNVAPIPQADSSAVALFAVADSVWTPISKRVGMTLLAAGAVAQLVNDLPQLPNLETACQAWAATTFPGMVGLSTDIASFATAAAVSFAQLDYAIAQAQPGDTVSKANSDLAAVALAALAQQAAPLVAQCTAIETQIQAFAAENQTADGNYQMFYWVLGGGSYWPVVASAIPTITQAMGAVAGAWKAIADRFNAAAAAGVQGMQSSLLSSELQQAMQSWMTIAGTASAFTVVALGQQQFLSGASANS